MVSPVPDAPLIFPYQPSEGPLSDFATRSYVQEADLGVFIALVMRVQSVEMRTTSEKCEPYLVVHGTDMDGRNIGPLRLWRFEEADVKVRKVYIFRGLKVVLETVWSMEEWKYIPRQDKAQTVECTSRTAVENVSRVPSIAQYFSM